MTATVLVRDQRAEVIALGLIEFYFGEDAGEYYNDLVEGRASTQVVKPHPKAREVWEMAKNEGVNLTDYLIRDVTSRFPPFANTARNVVEHAVRQKIAGAPGYSPEFLNRLAPEDREFVLNVCAAYDITLHLAACA